MARERFVEGAIYTSEIYKKQPMNENVSFKVQESTGEKEYKAKAVYTFPISRPDQENLNGRVYTSKLWERIIKEKQGEGSYGLIDHPNDDGSFDKAWCVWRNLRFSEDRKLILADAYLFGDKGQKVLEALECSGKIGLSTSGFGELNHDSNIINEETYELERVADLVMNPSYQVFGTQEDLVVKESIEAKVEETKIAESEEFKETKEVDDTSKDKEELKKMNKSESKSSPSFEEKAFVINMKAMFKEAKEETNVYERSMKCKTLLEYFKEYDCPFAESLKNEIQQQIDKDIDNIRKSMNEADGNSQAEADLKKKLADAEKAESDAKAEVETLKKELDDMKKKEEESKKQIDASTELLESLRVYSKKQQELYKQTVAEKNAMISVKEYKEAIVYGQSLEEQIKTLKAEIVEARKLQDTQTFTEKTKAKDEEETGDDEKEADKVVKIEKSDFVSEEVANYYSDLEYANPKVSIIKEDIAKCRTLMEAQRTYLRLKSLVYVPERKLSCYHKPVQDTKDRKISMYKGWD